MVRTSRRGRDNPGSTPGVDTLPKSTFGLDSLSDRYPKADLSLALSVLCALCVSWLFVNIQWYSLIIVDLSLVIIGFLLFSFVFSGCSWLLLVVVGYRWFSLVGAESH